MNTIAILLRSGLSTNSKPPISLFPPPKKRIHPLRFTDNTPSMLFSFSISSFNCVVS